MDRRSFLGLAGSAVAAPVAGCVGSGQPSPPDYDVGMRASAFVPTVVEVGVGDTVVWRNTNSRAHTVTAYEASLPASAAYFATGGFGSETAAREAFWNRFGGAISTDDTFEHTFDRPGTYRYFCVPHEAGGMVGEVVVEA